MVKGVFRITAGNYSGCLPGSETLLFCVLKEENCAVLKNEEKTDSGNVWDISGSSLRIPARNQHIFSFFQKGCNSSCYKVIIERAG